MVENKIIEQNKISHPLIKLFFLSFFLFLLSISPVLIASKGLYLWYGDYNLQTIVFTERIHRLLHSEQGMPVYDWCSLLGMDFLAYGEHLFSPFNWLLYILPYKAVPYAHSAVMAIKVGGAAVTAYIYCRQYVKTDRSAFICGLLYAFSGFQLFNMVYQFSDRYLMFPLLLYTFDQLVINKKPFCFAALLALNNIMSLYFCWIFCVCIAIYYIVRTATGSFPRLDLKLFIRLGIECLCGICIGMFTMLPGIIGLSSNDRVSDTIFGHSLIAYEDTGIIFKIIESMFLIPDRTGEPWYFKGEQLRLSPPVLYVPLFAIVGVIYIWKRNRKEWYSVLTTVCTIIACVPVLNSVFSAFNANFYARWYFFPVLIMVMMTGMYIDNISKTDSKDEFKLCTIITVFWCIYGIYSVYFQEPVGTRSSVKHLWILAVSIAVMSLIVIYLLHYPNENLHFISINNLKQIVCVFCSLGFLSNSFIIIESVEFEGISHEVSAIWNDFVPIELEKDEFYRTSSCIDFNVNRALEWDYPTISFFNSSIDAETCNFFDSVDVPCAQNTNLTPDDYPICSFLSVKYDLYYNENNIGNVEIEPEHRKNLALTGFELSDSFNRYIAFKNSAYIPMGFTFDHYIKADDNDANTGTGIEYVYFDEDDEKNEKHTERQKFLLKAIWLTDEQIEKYGNILTELPDDLRNDTSDETYFQDCKDRAATACYEFITNNRGFTAKTDLPKENLVFFSVPYDKGFTAYVDGQETEIERVFNGLSAVYVPQGDHSIEFVYETPGLKAGAAVSVISAVVLFIYTAADLIYKHKDRRQGKKVS